ncbi:MAG: division/cell wall cluster transcriptional repressor MraZ [Leptolinea sp.]|jgi:MraZ protein|nr:division/cell wall cluster transcriptional repressor MraZ [Leptolinea sp.]
MFLGQYEHSIDDKGRLTIPARYRELLFEGAFITEGFDQNLMVLTSSAFTTISDRVNRMSMTDPTVRDLKRMMFSRANQAEIDKAGRMLIPAFLRERAQLKTDVVIAGMGDYFEIWSSENWLIQNQPLPDSEASSKRFAAFDLSVR